MPKKNNKDINLLYFDKNAHKKVNKLRIAGITILVILAIACLVLYIIYANNEEFRTFCDLNILHKEIEENDLKYIELEDYDKSNIFAYSKYIAILKDNKFAIYDSSGNKENELNIEISNPITNSNGRFFFIAEQGSTKAYLISGDEKKWEKDLDGNVEKVCVNNNGYSAVSLSGTAYKSVVVLFDEQGNEIIRSYISRTVVIDISISDDNKYLSIAEVNTSGTLIQSNIKVISVEKAKQQPEDAIIYTYSAPSNSLITDIKYQNRTKLICAYDDSVHAIKDNQDTTLMNIDLSQEKITFLSIDLNNYIVKNIEESAGLLNTNTIVKIINSNTQSESTYKFEGVIKELYCSENKIALNLGSEIHFIDTNGWLIKKYTSSQEVRKIVISGQIAGIVYRNKIEIINF